MGLVSILTESNVFVERGRAEEKVPALRAAGWRQEIPVGTGGR